MSRRISFKLYEKDTAGNPIDELQLSLAFQRHCQREFVDRPELSSDLNLMVKRVWLRFLRDSVDRTESNPKDLVTAGLSRTGSADVAPKPNSAEVNNGAPMADVAGDSSETTVEPPSTAGDPQEGPASTDAGDSGDTGS